MRSWKARISIMLAAVLMLTQFAWPLPEVKAASTNLALGKTVTASEEDSTWGNVKENAVDGSTTTKWAAASAIKTSHWLQVDLGGASALTGATVQWGDTEVVKYKVEVSADGTNWTTAADRSSNSVKMLSESLTFEASGIRYVRVAITYYAGTGWWPAISELQVWGEQASKSPADIVSYSEVAVSTSTGVAPILPAEVIATYADASKGSTAVVWDAIDPGKYASKGSFSVQGTVAGASVQPTATVKVDGYRDDFIRGVDISTLTAIEDNGGKYYDSNGVERDLLDILKDRGVNYVRLRVFNDPQKTNGYNDKEDVIRLAKRVKAKGLQLLVDFHYSDDWAHPGQQVRPAAWKNYTFAQLTQAVHDYTYEVISELKQAGALPDMVQIGNEINSGVLTGNGGTVVFADQVALLNSGAAAVRELQGDDKIEIMIHLAEGGKNATFRNFFDGINNKVDYDIIGLSYYPFWHGTLEAVKANMDDMAKRYGKDVVIAETSYPFSYKDGDAHENIINTPSKLNVGGATWPATVEGQYDAIQKIMDLLAQVEDSKGAGFFYWEPAWIPANVGWIASEGDAWENQAMFDYAEYPANGGYAYEGFALDSLNVYKYGMKTPPADRQGLAKAIADASALVEADFVAKDWVNLKPAIEAAQAVHNQAYSSTGVTQAEVNAAQATLEAVVAAMEVIPADKSELNALIAEAELLVPSDWTAETWSKVAAGLELAITVQSNEKATQTSVNAAAEALAKALKGLSNVDKTALTALIIQILKLDGAEYLKSDWNAVVSALTEAQSVVNNESANQAEINAAIAKLQAAQAALVLLPDLTTDKTATASSNAGTGGGKSNSPGGAIDSSLDTSWGTDKGIGSWWQVDLGESSLIKKITMKLWAGGIKYRIEISNDNAAFTTVVDTTNDVITSEAPSHVLPEGTLGRYIKVTITDGGAWVGMLDFQALGLIPANKTALQAAITEAGKLSAEDYTVQSWQLVQQRLNAAVALNNELEVIQSQVDAAITALTDAIANLEEKIDVDGVILDKTSDTLNVGDSTQLTATVNPENASDKMVSFESADPDVAAVTGTSYDAQSGTTSVTVKAVGTGTTVITATTADGGYTATYSIEVKRAPVDKTALQAAIAEANALSAEDYTAQSWLLLQQQLTAAITVNSSIEVLQGEIDTAAAALKNAIAALELYEPGQPEVNADGVLLNRTTDTLNVGGSRVLSATVSPENATNKLVAFVSADPTVATVTGSTYDAASGTTSVTVNAVGAGSTVITATTADGGYTATYSITVNKNSTGPVPTPTPTVPEVKPTETVTGQTVTVDGVQADANGKLTASISADSLNKAAANAVNKQVVIHVEAPAGTKQIAAQIAASSVKSLASSGVETIRVELSGGVAITVAVDALASNEANGSAVIEIAAAQVPADKLNEASRAIVGTNPVYDLTMTIGGTPMTWKGGQVKVTLPYTLQAGQNPHQVVVYYLSENGEAQAIHSAVYDAASGTVTFTAEHFSQYAAVYAGVKFNDIAAFPWAKVAIEGLAAKGIVQGVSQGSYAPAGQVTRAQFVHMLVQALELKGNNTGSKLTDVKEGAWYYDSVSIAEQLGIVKGKPNGTFGINEQISREDMAVMLYRALEQTALLTGVNGNGTPFADQAAIADYAKEAVAAIKQLGIISGTGNGSFAPKANATRAEAAVIIGNTLTAVYH